MSPKKAYSIANTVKWNQMLNYVNQHLKLVQPNLVHQLNKLFAQRLISENIFVFIIQYIGLNLQSTSLNTSALWFATGTSCAYLLLRGFTVLPGMFLGTLNCSLNGKSQLCSGFIMCQYFFDTGFASTLVLLSNRQPYPDFVCLKKFIFFITYITILTGVMSYLLLRLCSYSITQIEYSLELWAQWWLGNLNGILIFSSAFITFDAYFLDLYSSKNLKTIYLIFGVLVFLLFMLSINHAALIKIILIIVIALYSMFISMHYGWWGSIAAAFISGIILCFAGIFDSLLIPNVSPAMNLLLLKLFLVQYLHRLMHFHSMQQKMCNRSAPIRKVAVA